MSRVGFSSGRGLAAVGIAGSPRFWSPARRLKGLFYTGAEKPVSIKAPEARQLGTTKAAARTAQSARVDAGRTARREVGHDRAQRSPEASRHASHPTPATMKRQ